MDETGFRIRVIAGRVVITHLTTKNVYLADPDNRESLTAVETVCADGSTTPPMLILKGDVLLEKASSSQEVVEMLAILASSLQVLPHSLRAMYHKSNDSFPMPS